METDDKSMKELSMVCAERDVKPDDLLLHTIGDDRFSGLGICAGDVIVFAVGKTPSVGQLSIIAHNHVNYPVLFLGWYRELLPILADTFIRCPKANVMDFHADLKYCSIAIMRENAVISL